MTWDCFALSGDIDRATVPSLRAELLAFVMRTNGDVTLNCANLVSIDRDGVRSLLALRDWLRREGRCLHVVNLSDSLTRELDTPVSGGRPI
jgi:anti-anti-sigma regulatory factor